MKKTQHGGKRKGSGRKAKAEGAKPKVSVSVEERSLNNIDAAAKALSVTRSKLIEQLGDKGVEWLIRSISG
jgi:hypothetical protein